MQGVAHPDGILSSSLSLGQDNLTLMTRRIATVKEATLNRLAGILEGYLRQDVGRNGKIWATEKRLESELTINHSPQELRELLESSDYSYLLSINPERLANVKKKFLSNI
jgi:hypothetical protein